MQTHEQACLGFMTREEVTAILASFDTATEIGRRDHLLFSLLYQTGARISEASNLRPADVKDRFVRLHGKGRKERAVPIPTQLMHRLHQHVQRHGSYPTNLYSPIATAPSSAEKASPFDSI